MVIILTSWKHCTKHSRMMQLYDSSDSEGMYTVRSQSHDGVEYEVGTSGIVCALLLGQENQQVSHACKHRLQ